MSNLTLAQLATLACLIEVSTPKPGNVHRAADFDDMTFMDMATAAVAIQPAFAKAEANSLGRIALDAAVLTQQLVGKNTNLGTILLFAPIAKAACQLVAQNAAQPFTARLQNSIKIVLSETTITDSKLIYEAIRTANPGGLGKQREADVADVDPPELMHAMRLAEERDLVAKQYTTDFETVFEFAVPSIALRMKDGLSREQAIIATHVLLMAKYPDSLIARKCGASVANESATRAQKVADLGEPNDPAYVDELSNLDFWLRSDGHRRNPGTTADVIAASLFVELLNPDGMLLRR